MANPGNTGQRYKMARFVSAEMREDGRISVTLSCGHSYLAGPSSRLVWFEAQIKSGKRTRCNECVADKNP